MNQHVTTPNISSSIRRLYAMLAADHGNWTVTSPKSAVNSSSETCLLLRMTVHLCDHICGNIVDLTWTWVILQTLEPASEHLHHLFARRRGKKCLVPTASPALFREWISIGDTPLTVRNWITARRTSLDAQGLLLKRLRCSFLSHGDISYDISRNLLKCTLIALNAHQ